MKPPPPPGTHPSALVEREMRLIELCEAAAALLESLLSPAERGRDARVSEGVDERVVRYYASLGLVDRPLRREGREAIYGRRHLQQILAVKRLQAEGLSLAQVQRRLAGATGEDLQALALPEGVAPHEPPELPEARRLLLIEIAKGVQLLIDPSRAPAAALDPAFPSRILTLLRTSS